MDRADRRRVHVRIEPDALLPDLQCAPAWLVPLEAYDPRLDLDGQLVGVAIRPAQAVGEARQGRSRCSRKAGLRWMLRRRKDGR
jgi:hypothetical protein